CPVCVPSMLVVPPWEEHYSGTTGGLIHCGSPRVLMYCRSGGIRNITSSGGQASPRCESSLYEPVC
ncbi:MAG TPA: hypothetical protein VEL31_07755, partial [Ktedonobacteraceae bacterium]|nr:hypothetical protein [Ktedonobacteraceae bacterium]